MQDIAFNASYSPVFRPDTVGGSVASASSDHQQLSISAGSSARKAHFRRLYDIWQLSVQRASGSSSSDARSMQQARRAYSLLVRFPEFEWATNWRTGIAMVCDVDAQIRYLRECHAVHSRPATARAATREVNTSTSQIPSILMQCNVMCTQPIAVLVELILLLIRHHRYQQALSELEL